MLIIEPLTEAINYRVWFPPGTPAYSTTKTGRHDIEYPEI
jgi:hypothetical protein